MLVTGDRAGKGIGWECTGPGCVSQTDESRATAEAVADQVVDAATMQAGHRPPSPSPTAAESAERIGS